MNASIDLRIPREKITDYEITVLTECFGRPALSKGKVCWHLDDLDDVTDKECWAWVNRIQGGDMEDALGIERAEQLIQFISVNESEPTEDYTAEIKSDYMREAFAW